MKVWVRKRRFWWTACNPNEALGMIDSSTYFRARTKERAVEKCVRAFSPSESPWEEIDTPKEGTP